MNIPQEPSIYEMPPVDALKRLWERYWRELTKELAGKPYDKGTIQLEPMMFNAIFDLDKRLKDLEAQRKAAK